MSRARRPSLPGLYVRDLSVERCVAMAGEARCCYASSEVQIAARVVDVVGSFRTKRWGSGERDGWVSIRMPGNHPRQLIGPPQETVEAYSTVGVASVATVLAIRGDNIARSVKLGRRISH